LIEASYQQPQWDTKGTVIGMWGMGTESCFYSFLG